MRRDPHRGARMKKPQRGSAQKGEGVKSGVYRLRGYEAACNHGHAAWYGTPGLSRVEAMEELRRHRKQQHKTLSGGAR